MSDRREGPIVTLDGPAGSGKSSTAVAVAERLGFRHLDSGALYRALTYALLRRGVDPGRWEVLTEEDMRALDVDAVPTASGFRVLVGGEPVEDELRSPEVTRHVSSLAKLACARMSLIELQRQAGSRGRLVADGRDMGSVVFPDAEVKIYLVADVDERARRRLAERGVTEPDEATVADQAEELGSRDRTDSERPISPLAKPAGAHEIDTTRLAFDDQVRTVVELVRQLTLS